jgi:ABC-type transport system substrate-binding protein
MEGYKMNKKAIARTAAIFILVIIILGGALIGTIVYFMTLPETAPPLPGEFELSDLTLSSSSVAEGESVTVTVNVTNTGETEVTGTVTLALNDKIAKSWTVTLTAGGSQVLTTTVTEDAGTYTVIIPGTTLSKTLTVTGVTVTPAFVTDNKLIYESGSTYQWFDPHVSYYQYDWWTLWHSVETLLWYEGDNATKIIPWLAESYTRSTDGLHYNFTLRQGITFQDGTPFNATAVWFSFNRMLIMDGTSQTGVHGSQAAWMIQQLLNETLAYGLSGKKSLGYLTNWNATFVQAVLDENFVEILGEYKVRLNLLTATTQFAPIMACPFAAILSPASTINMDYEYGGWGTWNGDYDTYFLHMAGNGDTALNLPEDGWTVGTGAYYVDSVSPTTYKVVLKAYADYWGGPNDINLPPTGKTRIETIEYVYQPSFATRLLDLKAGTATAIGVSEANIFQVVDRDSWIDDGVLDSIISGATVHGVFPTFNTWWLDFNTNVTKVGGGLEDWQPFADWRLRMAVSCAVNMTYMNIYVNNRLSVLANNIVPPGTVPTGSYNPDVEPTFSFNLTRAEELLNDTQANPLTSAAGDFTYYNGTAVTSEVIDNSFGPDFVHGKVVELYVQSGATTFIEVLTTLTDNLNAIAKRLDMGIRFNVVIVPGGQQYTLASSHLIDAYMGGWIADYNHVLNWMQPMYLSTGTYMSWNLWNITALDDLYDEAVIADQEGNITRLLEINDEMNTLANQMLPYMVWWHDTEYFTRSTWLKGWYLNTNYGVDLWSTMYYEEP